VYFLHTHDFIYRPGVFGLSFASAIFMKIEIEITPEELQHLLEIVKNDPRLETVYHQLKDAAANADDSQKGEIPVQGDNAVIRRSE